MKKTTRYRRHDCTYTPRNTNTEPPDYEARELNHSNKTSRQFRFSSLSDVDNRTCFFTTDTKATTHVPVSCSKAHIGTLLALT